MKNRNISCVILAGGQGRRMGGIDKGLTKYEGKYLIEHVIAKLAPQVDDIIINANRNIDRYLALGFPVVADEIGGFAGPLAGIASAVPACRHDWIIIVPCDMPFLPDDLVSTLAAHTDQSKAIAVGTARQLQLVLLLHRSLNNSIQSFLSSNQHTVMRWVDSIDHVRITIDNENYLSNINTQAQLEI